MRWMRMPLIAAPMMMGMVLTGLSGVAQGDAASDSEWFRGQTVRPPASAPSDAAAGQGASGVDFGARPTPPPPPPGMAQSNSSQSDFPDSAVHDWVVASARAARSRALLHLAENRLNDTIRDAQWSFEHSDAYRQAADDEKKAYDAYTEHRQKALRSVVSDPKYQAAIRLRDQMGEKIARVRALAKPAQPPRDVLLAMASQKLQYAADAHNMERGVLDDDAAVQDARQKMVDASAKASALRAGFDDSIRMNAQVAEARRNLDQARVELITAEAYYSAAATAGALATDYSYYRHRWDGLASPVVAGWGPLGYGAGY